MVKIGLLSDTHGYIDNSVFKHFKLCDEIWHAGDIGNIDTYDKLSAFKTLRAVYGNIDGHVLRSAVPENQYFEIEGMKVFMTHIGGYPGRYNVRVKEFLSKNQAHLFICGHSHILRIMYDKAFQLLHINPGAAGNIGFHHVKTLVRFDIEQGVPKNMEVIELGKRAI
ncbi:MAG: metallophosphoesterase family protein [Bacteroidia bacterium]|nr:metallophosphoesterase family protein [Bacteroidia bacterium]MCZ2248534.1 metallophosphatase family protein [Bacteroidia bacterium]